MTQGQPGPWDELPEEKEARTRDKGDMQDIDHLKVGVGDTKIRVVGRYEFFDEHWFSKISRSAICPGKKTCPVCNHENKQKLFDEGNRLKTAGDEKGAKEIFKKAFSNYKPTLKYAVNVIDRKDGKIKIWKFSATLKDKIALLGKQWGDPSTYDLIVTRVGTTKETTKYDVNVDPVTARNPQPLTEAEGQLKTFNLKTIFKATPLDKIQAYIRGEVPKKEPRPTPTEVGASKTSFVDPLEIGGGLSQKEVEELRDLDDGNIPF